MICGLLGEKLGHSYSPEIHRQLGSYSYLLYEKKTDELEAFLKHGDFTGLNVTIPYKKAVIPYCDQLSPIAQKLGAVNTIVRDATGRLIGHNSDYYGFQSMICHARLDPKGKRVLVLGTGGASATVQAVLKEMGAKVAVISRTGKHNYQSMYRFKSTAIIVNATPVGMYPNNGERLVDLSRFSKLEGVLDLIYNPARTQLILDAEKLGLITENGLLMLIAQAKESAEWFTGQRIDDSSVDTIYASLSRRMENIALIGMPGCGKSTIGKLLAEKTQRTFVDADEELVKKAGIPIPEIFARFGEEHFRALETEILAQLGKRSGLVIATGGGCVTRQENYALLHQNSRIIWIRRDLSSLATDGRPLSQKNSVFELYERRKDKYQFYADLVVDNDTVPEAAADHILHLEDQL